MIWIPSLMLLGLLLVPLSRVGSRPRWVANHVMTGALLAMILGGVGLVMNLVSGAMKWQVFIPGVPAGLAPGILLDGFASILMMMIGFVGWTVTRYAVRNLTDDAGHGLFLKWTGITMGSILMGVLASNLAQMLLAFLLSGLSVHRLLTHHGNRPEAVRTAWSKFALNRLADALFLGGVVVLYRAHGTLDLQELYAAVTGTGFQLEGQATRAGLLLAVGAMIRSVQFPFHVWLPGSLEAPTPVSALLHAGVVNAGGMILIRVYPVLEAGGTWVLGLLVVVGTLTALTGALTMATQNTIKRQLVHGTVSQMGFMVMQVGLGCPAAALMHIVAHSVYKAHAFLSSGDSWMARVPRLESRPSGWVEILGFGTLLLLLAAGVGVLYGKGATEQPGLILLGFLMSLAALGWFRTHGLDARGQFLKALPVVIGLLMTYFTLHHFAHGLLLEVWGSSREIVPQAWLLVAVGLGFLALFLLENRWRNNAAGSAADPLRVHARNGFYLDLLWRRLVIRLCS